METETNIKSPCNDMCNVDSDTNLCTGCYRTMDEIIRWPLLTDEDKLKILEKVNQRIKEYPDLAG